MAAAHDSFADQAYGDTIAGCGISIGSERRRGNNPRRDNGA